jgi:GH18 family chitinase
MPRAVFEWWRGGVLCVLLALSAAQAVEQRVVAYVPTWCDVARLTATVPFRHLTHLNIAFVNPTTDAGDLEVPAGIAPLVARAHEHRVRVLVSLGGGAASEDRVQRERYLALIAPPRRAGFIRGILGYVRTHGYDGVDVDLEGPAITAEYAAFIDELATALRAEKKLLTAALSSGYGGEKIPKAALARFDFINLMAYDATGPWTPDKPGPHASVEMAKTEIAFWRARDLPADRLVLGVPFYGYSFNPDRTVNALAFKDIVARHPGAAQHDAIGTLFYNGFPAIRAKAALVTSEGLGGLMIWSLDQDAAEGSSLLAEIARAFAR